MQILKEEPYGGNSYSAVLGPHASNPTEGRQTGVTLPVLDGQFLLSTDENRIKAQFEELLMSRIESRIATVRRRDPSLAEALQSTYITDLGAGNFAWDGKVSREARGEWEGNCALLWLMLRRCKGQEGMQLDDAREMMHDDSKAVMDALRQAQGNWPTSLAREARRQARERKKQEDEAILKAAQSGEDKEGQAIQSQTRPSQTPVGGVASDGQGFRQMSPQEMLDFREKIEEAQKRQSDPTMEMSPGQNPGQ